MNVECTLCTLHIAHCAGRGCRQADKARREAELEVEAAGRKLEALEVNIFNIVLILILTKTIQEQLCRVQSKLRLSKQQAEDSELLVSASQARFLTNVTRCCTNDVLDMICQISRWNYGQCKPSIVTTVGADGQRLRHRRLKTEPARFLSFNGFFFGLIVVTLPHFPHYDL